MFRILWVGLAIAFFMAAIARLSTSIVLRRIMEELYVIWYDGGLSERYDKGKITGELLALSAACTFILLGGFCARVAVYGFERLWIEARRANRNKLESN